jgi:hypothetical protein
MSASTLRAGADPDRGRSAKSVCLAGAGCRLGFAIVAARGPWVIFVYGMRPRFWGDLRPVPQLRQLGDIAGDSRYARPLKPATC